MCRPIIIVRRSIGWKYRYRNWCKGVLSFGGPIYHSMRLCMLAAGASRELSPPFGGSILGNRYIPADYSHSDLVKLTEGRVERERRDGAPLDPIKVAQRTELIDAMVRRIKGHGGMVVFVRMPVSGDVRAVLDQLWPDDRYVDVFAHRINAPIVDSWRDPQLNGFTCPDGSHLDYRDAAVFTRIFADRVLSAVSLESPEFANGPDRAMARGTAK